MKQYVTQQDVDEAMDRANKIRGSGIKFVASEQYLEDIDIFRAIIFQKDLEISGLKYLLERKGGAG